MFNKESYKRHKDWYNQQFPTEAAKRAYLRKSQNTKTRNNIGVWLQAIFYNCLDPLLKVKDQKWLTIGDAYGFDAQYILENGNKATASDLTIDFLKIAQQEGILTDFSAQNAEHLSFEDHQFDYLLCKEAYHHFPRPYAALYEMIRVAKKGIVIIEPQDPISRMPFLLFILNTFSSYKLVVDRIWKNRFSYEAVGNFVYKISEREFEKFAAGLNLPLIAFKKINPNFYFEGADEIESSFSNSKFRSIYFKKRLVDLLVKMGVIPSQVLSAIIFKDLPSEPLLIDLKKENYRLVYIPRNPYLE